MADILEHNGYINSTETFGSVDGPGIRFVIFLSGCPLRCKYCHNPDTWAKKGEEKSPSEIFNQALRYRPYWKEEGGITVSGGEPLGQIDFLLDLFKLAKQNNVSTVIDTSGSPFTMEGEWFDKFNQLLELTDLFIVDIKHIDENEHIELTGKTGKNIRQMLEYLSEKNKPVWIRHVLVPGITDNDEYLIKTRDYIRTLKNVQRVEVLPYHSFGIYKWKELNLEYKLDDVEQPTKERVQNAQAILEIEKYDGYKK